ncbi:putative lipid II flippase FtsW [Ilumatobacter sp.]|uniref:putative lipid II flippase FtsW n=1 Tax=Ilumatobacter sp. TaxID=1967498 RepID=UPI003B522F3B
MPTSTTVAHGASRDVAASTTTAGTTGTASRRATTATASTSARSVQDRRRDALERLGVEPHERAPRRAGVSRRTPATERERPERRRLRREITLSGLTGIATRRERDEPTPRRAPSAGPPPGVWYGIVGVVVVFVMLGLVMVLSASAITEANRDRWAYNVFVRQSLWAGLGLVGLVVAAKVDYTFWRRLALPVAVVGVAAMIVPFVPGIGGSVNGARAWIRVGGLSIQPSEFLKLAVVLVTADLLTRRRALLNHRRATLVPLALIGTVGAGLCMAQGDLGSAIVLGSIVFATAWVAGVPARPLASMVAGAATMGAFFVVSSQARLDRFTAFLDVDGNKDRLAWQIYQGYVGIASGGVGGSGIGGSKTKLGYLPYAHSDFIFAIVADELGLIGAGAVIVGFVMLVWFGVQVALAAPDRFGMLLAGGISSWLGVQAVVNLGGVTGLMPVTGLTLPFFSAGGSSLFVSMVAVGLVLSVARRIQLRPS